MHRLGRTAVPAGQRTGKERESDWRQGWASFPEQPSVMGKKSSYWVAGGTGDGRRQMQKQKHFEVQLNSTSALLSPGKASSQAQPAAGTGGKFKPEEDV